MRTRGEFTCPFYKGYTGKCRNLGLRLGTTAAEMINRMYQRYIILITHRVLTSPHVVGGRRKPLGILPSGGGDAGVGRASFYLSLDGLGVGPLHFISI